MTSQTTQTNPPSGLNKPRRMLLLLGVMFLAPLALAFWMYYGSQEMHPDARVNHGELISPARPLPEAALATPTGAATRPAFLKDKWSMIYVGEGGCDAHCRQALHDMRQIRLSLAKDMDRVQTVFLYSGACCEQPFFSTEHASTTAAATDSEAGRGLLAAFGDARLPGRIYLSDPLGNLMMSYPAGSEPKGLREDLKRLLKLSHIG